MEYYLHTLQSEIKSVEAFAKDVRRKEQKALSNGRKLLGIYSRKHQKDEVPPVAPQFELPENPEKKALEDYERFWGLHRFRTDSLRKANRHNFVAYAYLKGKNYRSVEEKSRINGEPLSLYTLSLIVADHMNLNDNASIDEEMKIQQWLINGEAKFFS